MCDFLKIYMRKETIKCLFASGSSLSKKRKNDDAGKKKDNNKKGIVSRAQWRRWY